MRYPPPTDAGGTIMTVNPIHMVYECLFLDATSRITANGSSCANFFIDEELVGSHKQKIIEVVWQWKQSGSVCTFIPQASGKARIYNEGRVN
jgi:hypothetical protein